MDSQYDLGPWACTMKRCDVRTNPWQPSKLEGCWSAHPRCPIAVGQLVVEVQNPRSVSCNVIA